MDGKEFVVFAPIVDVLPVLILDLAVKRLSGDAVFLGMLVSSLFLIVASSAHCNLNCKWCCAGNMGIWTMLTKRYCRSRGLSSTVCSAKSSFLMLTDPPCLLLSLGLPLAG